MLTLPIALKSATKCPLPANGQNHEIVSLESTLFRWQHGTGRQRPVCTKWWSSSGLARPGRDVGIEKLDSGNGRQVGDQIFEPDPRVLPALQCFEQLEGAFGHGSEGSGTCELPDDGLKLILKSLVLGASTVPGLPRFDERKRGNGKGEPAVPREIEDLEAALTTLLKVGDLQQEVGFCVDDHAAICAVIVPFRIESRSPES